MFTDWIFAIGLLLIGLGYAVIGPRDLVDEVRSVFEWRLVRRGLRFNRRSGRLSLSDLLVLTTIAAFCFGMVRGGLAPAAGGWRLGAGLMIYYGIVKFIQLDGALIGDRRRCQNRRTPHPAVDAVPAVNPSDATRASGPRRGLRRTALGPHHIIASVHADAASSRPAMQTCVAIAARRRAAELR